MAQKAKHYTPQLHRFLVGKLYYAAKEKKIPMTVLANSIVADGLLRLNEIKITRIAEEPPNCG
jgi:hypothetical protein